eukprot:jgi/Bigna1/76616/fgenesh1_pg.42_\
MGRARVLGPRIDRGICQQGCGVRRQSSLMQLAMLSTILSSSVGPGRSVLERETLADIRATRFGGIAMGGKVRRQLLVPKAETQGGEGLSPVEKIQQRLGYSRFDSSDFIILEKIGEITFGEAAPTSVFVGGGSSIRLYAARLSPDRAVYESGEQASQTLVLREHTKAASDLGVREWAAYRHMGLDEYQPAATNSEPESFMAVLGAFVTQTVDAESDDEMSVWTVTRLKDLDRDGLSLAYEMYDLQLGTEKILNIFRRVAKGAVKGLLTTHQEGLAHGGIDSSTIMVTKGDLSNNQEMEMIGAGLSNFGYAAKLGSKDDKTAMPFLSAAKLAASAGKRGLDNDPVLAGSVARKEDMRRLAVALVEQQLPAKNLGELIPLDGGLEAWRSLKEQVPSTFNETSIAVRMIMIMIMKMMTMMTMARATASGVGANDYPGIEQLCEIFGADSNAGWEFIELLVGMQEGANPLLQLTRASTHRFIAV